MMRWARRQPVARTVVLSVATACACAAAAGCPAAARASAGSAVTWTGAAPPSGTVSLALPLKADLGGLERFATAVTTPGSPQYRRYAAVSALSDRFGAAARERSRVLDYLRHHGASSASIDVTGLFADATMKVAQAQRLFGTLLSDYRTARAIRYMAPSVPIRLPAPLRSSVTGVVGLDTQPVFGTPQAMLRHGTGWPHAAATAGPERAADQSGYPQRTGTSTGCGAATSRSGFTPNQYLTAYGYAPLQAGGLRGEGERVALIEIDGFKYSDLHRFASCFGLSVPAIHSFGVNLRRPLAPGGETTLDLEVLDAAAPRLRAVDVYESDPDAAAVLRSLTAPLSNSASRPDVISASLGACEAAALQDIGESGLRTAEGSLALAAATGISVLASSGDDGSSSCLGAGSRPDPTLAVSYPASSPWVTAVGGTNVSLNSANEIVSQQVWNDAPLVVAAGGGGLSDLFQRPEYQTGSVSPNRRAVPDVSMLADVAPGYEIYCTVPHDCLTGKHAAAWSQVGGTSAAAPLLAGGLALIDENLRRRRQQSLGLANPLLYRTAHLPQGRAAISDVLANTNDLGQSISGKPLGCCSAGPGFDYASGLGSVDVGGLAAVAQMLAGKSASVSVSVPFQRHPVASGRLRARIACSSRCLARIETRIGLGRSAGLISEQSKTYLLRAAGARTLTIVFAPGALRRLRAALERHQRVTATLGGVSLDPSGLVDARTRPITVSIRR